MGEIIIPYTAREAFKPYHANTLRYSATVAHRRAGKTVARINKLIKDAARNRLLNPRFGYLAPYYVQAKDIAWLYVKHYTAPFIPYGLKINESELSVTLPHNGAQIKLYGAENANRIRGLYFDGIAVDEGQGIQKKVLTSVILPALADRKGWLDISGTPMGWENLLGEIVRLARNNPEWFLQILKASETGIIPQEELDNLRRLMPENEYAQEFECDFDAAITGAVYGKWIAECERADRFVKGIYVPELPVHTAWDLGYDDATAIWFFQIYRNEIRIIHYYENNNQDIKHYCDYIKARPYAKWGDHYVPHDAANKLLAAGGRSIVDQAYAEGVKMRIVNATSQQNQIEAARMTLGQCWFDPIECAEGIAALKQYQFEYDEDKQTHKSVPRHDWASHGSDAFEIIGQVWQETKPAQEKPKPRFFQDLTAAEVFWPST